MLDPKYNMNKELEIAFNNGEQTKFVNYKLLLVIIVSFVVGICIKHFASCSFYISESKMSTISVDRGDKLELTLADGTKVVLNCGSELQFPNTFSGASSRNVTLKGEGYFEVQQNNKPFVVNTEFGRITALGTKFNVRAYEDERFETTLIDGSIKYKINNVEKVLKPGQQIIIDKDKRISLQNIKDTSFLEWTNGTISFSHEKLGSVIKNLERHYDVDIKLDPDLATIKFTGVIRDESIEDVLTLINIITPINYEKNSRLKLVKITSKK